MDIKLLPYPMFETTDEEKQELRESLNSRFSFLCTRLYSHSLITKVRNSIRNMGTLEEYFVSVHGFPRVVEDYVPKREEWTRQLIAYKGE